jgi:hypothetical protein
LVPRNAAADSGSIPFFKINGVFSDPYPLQYVTSKYFDIPQSQLKDTFLPGEKIDFTVDYRLAAFMNYIRKRDFKPFGYYRIIVGLAVLCITFIK